MLVGSRTRNGVMGALVIALLVCLAGCAPHAVSSPEGDEAESALSQTGGPEESQDLTGVVWNPDSDCAMCHEDNVSTMSSSVHGTVDCFTCHATASLEEVHKSATSAPSPKYKVKGDYAVPETCNSCHAQVDLAETTAACTVLTDENGTVCNPHALPEGETHLSQGVSDCGNCHSLHAGKNNAANYCAGCHHENVYECNTCH